MSRPARRFCSITALTAVLLVAALSGSAQAYPRRCGTVHVTGGTFTAVSTTRVLTCSWGKDVLRTWKRQRLTARKVTDRHGISWSCSFDRAGTRRGAGTCIAGKNGGVAFRYRPG